jgi:trimeric autotransporter adhesin
MKRLCVLIPIAYASLCSLASGQNQIIRTVAGGGSNPVADGVPATAEKLSLGGNSSTVPAGGLAIAASGNIYISDTNNNRVLLVSGGNITTVVGPGGLSAFPPLYQPAGLALDAAGDLFIADYGNDLIREVKPGSNNVVTVAGSGSGGYYGDGGLATSATLNGPAGVSVDASGNIFIADSLNNVIREVTASNGNITTVGGSQAFPGFSGDNGPATSAGLNTPTGVFVGASGSIFIADRGNNRIRKFTVGGNMTTVAGNGGQGHAGIPGPATSAQLYSPSSVVQDASGNLFITAIFNNAVLEVSAATGNISTVAGLQGTSGFYGDGGPATSALLDHPGDAIVDASGDVFIADTINNRIREVSSTIVPSPSITPGGVVPIYSTVTTIQEGEWVSIYGNNLGPTPAAQWTGNFPQQLGGTSVTINGNPAYLYYVSPTLINLQAPNDATTGEVNVVVTTAGGSFTSTVTLAAVAPSFLLFDKKHVTGIIVRSDGSGSQGGGTYDFLGPTGNSLGFPTVAAKAGDSVQLYAVGLGPTNPAIVAGQPFTANAAPTTNQVTLKINNTNVLPGFAGFDTSILYQINLTVPAGLGTGDVPLVATVAGVETQTEVVISLQ